MYNQLARFARPRNIMLLLLALVGLSILSGAINSPRGSFGHSPPIWVGLEKHSTAEIYTALDGYGETGRDAIKQILLLDTVYAMIWPLLLGSIIAYTWRRVAPKQDKLIKILTIIPFVGFFLDLLQNLSIWLVLKFYPVFMNNLAELSSYLSIALWASIYMSIALTIIGLIGLLGGKTFRRAT